MDLYAEPRATKDIDFFVESAGRAKLGSKRLPLEAAWYRVAGRRVNLLFARPEEDALFDTDLMPVQGIPVLSARGVCLLKLRTDRTRDRIDVLAMLTAGSLDRDAVLELLRDFGGHEDERRFAEIREEFDAQFV